MMNKRKKAHCDMIQSNISQRNKAAAWAGASAFDCSKPGQSPCWAVTQGLARPGPKWPGLARHPALGRACQWHITKFDFLVAGYWDSAESEEGVMVMIGLQLTTRYRWPRHFSMSWLQLLPSFSIVTMTKSFGPPWQDSQERRATTTSNDSDD